MKRDLLPILACPTCKAPLELTVEAEDKDQVIAGSLRCTQNGEVYRIADGIPDLLPKPPKR